MSSSDSRLKSMVVDENRYQWTYMTYPFLCVNCWSKGSCYRRNSAGSLLATGTTTNDQLLLVS